MFYWLLVWDIDGKYTLDGPYNSYSQAERIADKLDVVGYEIEKLPTMNRFKATGLFKSIMAEREPEKFRKFKRFRHKKHEESE